MLASQLMDLRGMLHSQGVIFAYSGYVTEPVLSGVAEALKQKLTIDDADTKTLRSVFAVFVEQMQNIIRYSAEKAQPALAPRIRSPRIDGDPLRHSPSAGKAPTTWSARAISSSAPTLSAYAQSSDKEDDMMQELGEEFGEDLENVKFHLEKMPG